MVSTVVLLCCFSSVIYIVASQSNKTRDGRCEEPVCFYFGAELVMGLNTSIDPCDNFYDFACGQWEKYYFPETMSVPERIQNKINRRIRALLEGSINKEEEALFKAQKFYNHCLKANMTELKQTVLQELDEYGGFPVLKGVTWDFEDPKKSLEDLLPFIARLRRKFLKGGLFQISVSPIINDNSKMIIQLVQPSKILPIEDTKNTKEEELIASLQWLKPELNGEIVMEEISHVLELRNNIEKNIQEFNRSEMPTINYVFTVEEFTNVTKMDWLKLLNLIFEGIHEVKPEDEIQVIGINYFKNLRQFANNSTYSPRSVMNYELFYYYLPILNNVKSTSNNPSKCADLVGQNCYGYVLSAKYGSAYLHTEPLVETARTMTVKMFETYDERLVEIDWLDNFSRNAIREKLTAMKDYFLYPTWTTNKTLLNEYYKDLEMKENVMQDLIACGQFETMYNYQTLKRSIKLNSWDDFPLVVDAEYVKTENTFNIFEGIMQYPFFNEDLLQVMNYGALGFIIGHEITHSIDTNGILYDKNGNFNPCLTPNAESAYQKRTQCFINQYSRYAFTADELPGTNGYKINGTTTLNENIADNGGIRQAFKAYKKWTEEFGEETLPDSLRQFSNDQVFFMSMARSWCATYGNTANWTKIFSRDNHTPPKFRIIGTLTNLKEFSDAFQCSEDSRMNGGNERCILW